MFNKRLKEELKNLETKVSYMNYRIETLENVNKVVRFRENPPEYLLHKIDSGGSYLVDLCDADKKWYTETTDNGNKYVLGHYYENVSKNLYKLKKDKK